MNNINLGIKKLMLGAGTDKAPRLKKWNELNTDRSSTLSNCQLKGIVFTKEQGVKFEDETYLVCLDLDTKEKYGNNEADKKTMKEKVMSYLAVKDISKVVEFSEFCEDTQNNGTHIWVRVKELKEFKNITVDSEHKKEIEIFTKDKFVVVYNEELFSKFHNAPLVSIKDIEGMTKAIEENHPEVNNIKEYQKETIGRNKLETITKNLVEKSHTVKAFVDGKDISNPEIREVARCYMFLNQDDVFTDLATSNWNGRYAGQWKNYIKNYLKATNGNRLPKKNSEHYYWLKGAGAFEGGSLVSQKEKIKDGMLDNFKTLLGNHILRLEDTFFVFTGRSYEWLDLNKVGEKIYDFYMNNGEYLNSETIKNLTFHIEHYMRKTSLEYNINSTEVDRIPLAFNNGTLYIDEKQVFFKENKWFPEDKCFIEFKINYTGEYKSNSLFEEWLKSRFETENKIKFFQLSLANIFSTTIKTEVHPYFYGTASIGKSTFVDMLTNCMSKNSVAEMSFEQVEHQFGAVATLRNPIIISEEISQKRLKDDNYKRLITRSSNMYEMKGIQNFQGQPISKFLSFANSLPNIDVDQAVARRLLTMEVQDGRIRDDLNILEFSKEMNKCHNELISFIVKGIREMFAIGFNISGWYHDTFETEAKELRMHNNSFEWFVEAYFEKTDYEDEYANLSKVMFAFEHFRTTQEGQAVKSITMSKLGLNLSKCGLERIRKRQGGKVVKVVKGYKIKPYSEMI